MMMKKTRLLTGLQPSGDLHIGNYFGALKPFVDEYEKHESFLMVADYHALTSKKDPSELRQNIFNIVRSYIAVGVDPKKAVIFKQSDVSEHTELAWIFNCLVSVPFLMQAHSYKDKVAKGLEANAGLFTYPMLMAADILLYDTDVVPVGEDQRQHIEYAREAAAKFNNVFGATFKEPKEMILKHFGTVLGTDNQKMSKSYGNITPLFGSDEQIHSSVMSMITDSTPANESKPMESALIKNLSTSASAYLEPVEVTRLISEVIFLPYKEIKQEYEKSLLKWITPMRKSYQNISDEEVIEILRKGAEKAREIASAKMKEVRQKVGVAL